jgi:hypothetical protein
MSLLEKIKDFGLKKVVAPAMMLGAGLGLYQGNAQEVKDYQLRNFVPLASFTLDHDNDGFEDIFIITKNPYEKQANIQRIKNIKGILSTEIEKQEYLNSIPMQNNTGIATFKLKDKDGYEDIYITTKDPKSMEAAIYKIDNIKGILSTEIEKQEYLNSISLGSPKN